MGSWCYFLVLTILTSPGNIWKVHPVIDPMIAFIYQTSSFEHQYSGPPGETVTLVYSSPPADDSGISWRSWLNISSIGGIKLRLVCSLVSLFLTVSRSANQTKISWPSSCCWSWTSPQSNLQLSSLTWKPKYRDKYHHTVFWSVTILESHNYPA